ncbi:cation:proton antiporter [Microbacterium terricola]|uniref:Peptidase n=1 Tax=Microbacterium terricola TaxID=344163 RepID=A0ABM8DV63_9MICO|nr:sodium:proton antiporter [Microbacterium terricola]UYK39748.1 sodium:proton antiporter [Microbacterium terricola]BDV29502.1 peptidase [Microbacterium terricola]
MDVLLVVVIGVIAVAVTTALAQKLGVAGPLMLMGLGIAVSVLPFVPPVEVEPELILVGVLPPLLYSAAVNLPAIEFRRDFGPISGLAVVLVVGSSLLLGVFFFLAIPEVGFPLGVALGAILSPTDAVATSIVRRLGITPRVVTMLEGESLLNDATALVLLRTAIAAIAGGFSLWGAVGSFAVGIVVAVVVGAVLGWITLRLRAWVHNSAANTAIGFTVPFLAYLPTEHLGGSGLVAAVVAGLVTGQGAARWFTPEQRLSDQLNWRTIELVLEGAVFLMMGLELKELVRQNVDDGYSVFDASWLALAALAIILLIRAVYVSILIWIQTRRARGRQRERLDALSDRIDEFEATAIPPLESAQGGGPRRGARGGPGGPTAEQARRRMSNLRGRVARSIADLDYYQAAPLGWKHGAVIVWAGMRGVVTLAAAQTLDRDIDGRALLILIAFFVAAGSLLLQGLTLPWLVRRLQIPRTDADRASHDEQQRLAEELRDAATAVLSDPDLRRADGEPFSADMMTKMAQRAAAPPSDDASSLAVEMMELRLATLEAMRGRLNEISSGGTYSTAALRHALADLDADQLALERRLHEDG